MSLKGINHVVLKVRNLSRAEAFYAGILGFRKVGERPGMLFFSGGGHAHDLALTEVGEEAAAATQRQVGLFHFAVTVSDEAALVDLARRCREKGVRINGTADNIVSRSFYIADPDGNMVELTVDTPEEEWTGIDNPFLRGRPFMLPAD